MPNLMPGSIASSITGRLGPSPSFESISTVTVSTAQSTISFTSIPATYSHLQLRVSARSTYADTESFFKVNLNGDTGSNYPNHFLTGDGTNIGGYGYSTSQYAYMFLSSYPAANATSSIFGSAIIDILDYKNTNKNKTVRSFGGFDRNSAGIVRLNSSVWLSANAITSISITDYRTGNFAQHSSFALYGIRTA
jgi:hypothetical protein